MDEVTSYLLYSLAAVFFEIFKKKFFGLVLDPIKLPNYNNLKYSPKNDVFKFFE